jgi:hypothetical protein
MKKFTVTLEGTASGTVSESIMRELIEKSVGAADLSALNIEADHGVLGKFKMEVNSEAKVAFKREAAPATTAAAKKAADSK